MKPKLYLKTEAYLGITSNVQDQGGNITLLLVKVVLRSVAFYCTISII